MNVRVRIAEPDVVVIGAGVAGLTAAALVARGGLRVHVLERHTLPGGCASFYQRGGYRFDVGATLAGGFGERGVHRRVFARLGVDMRAERVEPAMAVHIDERVIARYGDERWPAERRRWFGAGAEAFWSAQERIAGLAWDLSARFPALPADPAGAIAFARAIRPRHLPLAMTLGRTVSSLYAVDAPQLLRAFVDAQLLITSQADAETTDLAYGATALDLAREGTYHLPGGISAIAIALARSIRANGGAIAYGTAVHAVEVSRGAVTGVTLEDGTTLRARSVIAAVPAAALADLVARGGAALPLAKRVSALPERWSAFTAYIGLPAGAVPTDLPLHHQLVADSSRPLGEGNSTFLSFSGPAERARARGGGRAVTISTHTDVARWERAAADGSFADLRERYGAMLTAALDRVVPGAAARADIVEFGTPLTFARYTGRPRGLVGGVPQTPASATLGALSHRSGIRGLRVCGDSVFPGQSTVGTSLSGSAAASAVLRDRRRGAVTD